jgi:hypothetical protein
MHLSTTRYFLFHEWVAHIYINCLHPDEKMEVKANDILHRYDCSPYCGKELFGTVQQTIVNGFTVYQNKKVVNKNSGKWLLKK